MFQYLGKIGGKEDRFLHWHCFRKEMEISVLYYHNIL